jgi:tRNA (guanine-N7-)-methyltransferase
MTIIETLVSVNPFRSKVEHYPGQLFSKPVDEANEIRELCTGEVFLEFGSGSGMHLIEQASKLPSANFIGFEIRFKRSVRTIEKAQKVGVHNLYVVRGLSDLASSLIPDTSVSGLWVNFPDPWEKPSRQKNRILNSRSLEVIYRKLKPGGFISFKTDHSEMFESTLEAIYHGQQFKIESVTRDLHKEPGLLVENVMTEFENLFCSKGLPVHLVRVVKEDGSRVV